MARLTITSFTALLMVSSLGLGSSCQAESVDMKNGEWAALVSQAKLDGEKQAEKDFKDGTPKVASVVVERFGREFCEAGFGAPEDSKKMLQALPRREQRCGDYRPWSVADAAYVAAYNQTIVALLRNSQVNKRLDGSANGEQR